MKEKNLSNLQPLIEDLKIDLMVIAKDLRVIGVKLKGANMNLIVYKLLNSADKLDNYVGRLE